jgi:thymidine phosphorylase
VPLITASILSKKLAAGLQGLVLDVKCGSGAFMDNVGKARELATSLVEVANGAGLKTTALITDMNEPLATAAGNAVEMRNAVQFLTGEHVDARLWDITVALGGEMLVSGGLASTPDDGQKKLREAFQSGAACEIFGRMVAQLGGPTDFIDKYQNHLRTAPIIRPVHAPVEGSVIAINARKVGLGVVALGGGRTRPQDKIDHAVGYSDLAGIGDHVDPQQPLAMVHANSKDDADAAAAMIIKAYMVGNARDVEDHATIIERVDGA